MKQAFPLEIFRKKGNTFQRYSSFLVFTGITGKSLYHLLYHTSAMPLGKISLGKMASSFMSQCPTCGWTPLWVIAVPLRLQVSVIVTKTLIFKARYLSTSMFSMHA